MAFGLDYVSGPSIADMKAAGVSFVCRYLSEVNPQTEVKILKPDEAKALSAAGIAIVSNYEWYATRALEGAASGAYDAHIAEAQHAACGGSPSRPIYFSVDVDVAGSQAIEYFKGVASVIGLARTGAYGSFRVLQALFNAGVIAWGWQTYAWSGGAWESRAHIQQYQNGVVLAGHAVDYNRSIKSDFGQWLVGGTNVIPTGWHDDGTILTAPNNVKVGTGMRSYVLAHNWAADNLPLAAEFHTQQVEGSNPSLGGGSYQYFRWIVLEYTQARGVFEMWTGQELQYTRNKLAETYNAYQQALQQIQSLQAQVKASSGLDAAKVANRLTAIGVEAQKVVTLTTQPF